MILLILCVCRYLDVCDPATLGPFVARHGPFFSLCQSVFYIFVFRHQSLVEMEKGERIHTTQTRLLFSFFFCVMFLLYRVEFFA